MAVVSGHNKSFGALCVWCLSKSLHRFCPGTLRDLRALLLQKEAAWNHSGQAWLLDVYDWDLVVLDHASVATLRFGLRLCFGLFPCTMHIKGEPIGVMQRQGTGYISCLSSDGCETLRLESVKFFLNCFGVVVVV